MDVEQRRGRYFAHAQDDMNPRLFEGTFSLDAAQLTDTIIVMQRLDARFGLLGINGRQIDRNFVSAQFDQEFCWS